MSENALEIRNLSVRYGSKHVVRDVSFRVERGAVYAFLGRNGAGKSSLVRCLLGQQRASSGSAVILGRDAWRHRAALMREVGVVPEDNDIPPLMTARQVARFLSRLHRRWDADGFHQRLQRIGISANQPFQNLSKGQKRQVSLAAALAHRPTILVLDDPTLGLDAVARKSLFSELIGELADRETTILLTTHDLAAADLVATHVGILSAGRLVIDEELEPLKRRWRAQRSLERRPVGAMNGALAVAVDDRVDEDEVATSLEEIFAVVTREEI